MPLSKLSRAEIVRLGEEREGPCVSIYMPLGGISTEVKADQTRIANLGDRAIELLKRLHLRADEARQLVEPPIAEAQAGIGKWNRPGSGLALFFAPAETHTFIVPEELAEHVGVGPRYLTRQLMPLVEYESPTFLLALGMDATRLYRLTPTESELVNLPDMPESIDAVERFEDTENPERFLTTHSGGRVLHGQGGPGERSRQEVETEYLREVSSAVRQQLHAKGSLLVLAGAKSVTDEFRKIARDVTTAQRAIQGSVGRMNGPDLAVQARAVISEESERRRGAVAKTVTELWADRRVTRGIVNVLPQAVQGRIMDLFVASDAEQWGRIEGTGKVIEEKAHISLASDDLLDLAAHHTLANGGTVHAVAMAEMPGSPEGGTAVALLRT